MTKVLITGGEGDIARAICEELNEAGCYDVYAPGKTEMDVTNLESIRKYISGIRPDILINNAGYVVPNSIKNADFECSKKHIEVNLLGVFWCTQTALVFNSNVNIINIASAAAVEVHSTWSEYCATKAAVVMATKCWAEDNLYAVAISPGRTKTKMRKALFPDEDQSTLLDTKDFAKVVMKAIRKEYPTGEHIIVRKQNVEALLNGEDV